MTAGDLPVRLKGGVGTTDQADHNLWTLTGTKGAIRLRDWSFAERLTADGKWVGDADAPSHEVARPMILQGQVTKLAAMVRGEPHDLATVAEALEVQMVVERILATG